MPKPRPLVIPYQKPPFTDEQIMVDLQVIQRWVNAMAAGGYASLTGPGETQTPGDLTQAGGLAVNAPVGSVFALSIGSSGNTYAHIADTGTSYIFTNTNFTLGSLNGSLLLEGHTSVVVGAGAEPVYIQPSDTALLRFFSPHSAGADKQFVTGSRSANAALASLLTALANLGLIFDTTTV